MDVEMEFALVYSLLNLINCLIHWAATIFIFDPSKKLMC